MSIPIICMGGLLVVAVCFALIYGERCNTQRAQIESQKGVIAAWESLVKEPEKEPEKDTEASEDAYRVLKRHFNELLEENLALKKKNAEKKPEEAPKAYKPARDFDGEWGNASPAVDNPPKDEDQWPTLVNPYVKRDNKDFGGYIVEFNDNSGRPQRHICYKSDEKDVLATAHRLADQTGKECKFRPFYFGEPSSYRGNQQKFAKVI